MAFRNIDKNSLCKFNSQTSSEFISEYERIVEKASIDNRNRIRDRFIVPSSFRCDRISWFRLRGIETDKIDRYNLSDSYIESIGDSVHYKVQKFVSHMDDFKSVSVADYLKKFPVRFNYELEISTNQMETKIRILDDDYPVQMSCDGILFHNDRYYILEIKTSEYSSWSGMNKPKYEHISQVKMYSAFLGIKDILMFYVERQYGGIKCFEVNLTDKDVDDVMMKIRNLVELSNSNICPEPLGKHDSWCTSNRCSYFKTCKLFGR